MMISPTVVVISLVACLSLATPLFFFYVPPSLQNIEKQPLTALNKGFNYVGAYGVPTSEIDWCEYNHVPSNLMPSWFNHYVAEPENSITSLFYCFLAMFSYSQHKNLSETRQTIILLTLFTIGLGSSAFHGTLLYANQLFDELPMIYLIVAAAWAMSERNNAVMSLRGKILAAVSLLFVGWMTAMLTFLTVQDSRYHNFTRGSGVFAFAFGLIYVFYASALASNEHSLRLLANNEIDSRDMPKAFTKGFVSIIVALVSWVVDNLFCTQLQSLRHTIGFYPNLHSYGWHFGTAIAVYYLAMSALIHRRGVLGMRSKIVRKWGVIEVVVDGGERGVGGEKESRNIKRSKKE